MPVLDIVFCLDLSIIKDKTSEETPAFFIAPNAVIEASNFTSEVFILSIII